MHMESFSLRSGCLVATVQSENVERLIVAEESGHSIAEQCRHALLAPMGLPELGRCVVPGDSVVIVVDPETPSVAELLAVVCEQFQSLSDEGVSLTLLLPTDLFGTGWSGLIEQLPLHLREQLTVHVHDSAETSQLSYLASSAGGDRVYVNRRIADADLLVSIGVICFDSLLGYKGTTSNIFPGFSDAVAIQQSRTHGHPELTPDEPRPYRQLIDEVGWLLGTQFSVQIIPGPGKTPLAILAGLPDNVMAAGKEIVDRVWRVAIDRRVESVVLSVPADSTFGWKQFGTAVERASRLVESGGRIIVVADLPVPEGPAATLLRRSQDPSELLKPLRREPSQDSVEIVQLIHALRHARVYLHSRIPADIVEELGMIPIGEANEIQRLTIASETCVVLPNANYAWID